MLRAIADTMGNRVGSNQDHDLPLIMRIRRLTTDDIEVYREIRLRALRSDPHAFGSSYDREVSFDDATWRDRLSGFDGRSGTVFISEYDDEVNGMVGIARSEVDTDAVLWGMWVDPAARGSGIAARLVAAANVWVLEQDLGKVVLWVHRANDRAIAFYKHVGFEETVAWKGERPAECEDERCMTMTIYAATP